ncbi:hypothetical protein [Asticcacaulis sp.]|uniref:hypothetical protein n=1 Tax=Asticcacaulis sp. TaxID=1872648 RepID=UPI00391AEE8B
MTEHTDLPGDIASPHKTLDDTLKALGEMDDHANALLALTIGLYVFSTSRGGYVSYLPDFFKGLHGRGLMLRAVEGIHPAHELIQKRMEVCAMSEQTSSKMADHPLWFSGGRDADLRAFEDKALHADVCLCLAMGVYLVQACRSGDFSSIETFASDAAKSGMLDRAFGASNAARNLIDTLGS